MKDDRLVEVGYSALVRKYGVKAVPHYCRSFVAKDSWKQSKTPGEQIVKVYPKPYLPDDTDFGRLEFALKYEGINLHILKLLFEQMGPKSLEAYVKSKPTGKSARKLWFLYEYLLDSELEICDAKSGNYADLLDRKDYYTTTSRSSKRHRIRDNLLGNKNFCPMVRRTKTLEEFFDRHLDQKARHLVSVYDSGIVARATHYLYSKETLSSYEIERERPNKKRMARFIDLLRKAESGNYYDKKDLIHLQQHTVDPRFADVNYRKAQNYVGEQAGYHRQRIHFISPRPEDLDDLMGGLLRALTRMSESKIDPVVIAATISFGFVFIHPFDDGNGRIHRFLIHQILSKEGFSPKGMIFPVSATILNDMQKYDRCLESFSTQLMPVVDYDLDPNGKLTVNNDTVDLYRYLDMTAMAEYLYGCIDKTIEVDFVGEIEFIIKFDLTRRHLQEIVDMPDRYIDLFIKCCLQNRGKLSKTKRHDYFEKLTDSEIVSMEKVVNEFMLESDRNYFETD